MIRASRFAGRGHLLMLWLARLSDQAARALRHLAERSRHFGDRGAHLSDSDPLGRFLQDYIEQAGVRQ